MGSWPAAEVAAEIDRLVLGVNEAIDESRLSELAPDLILDWVQLYQLGDFMAAGVLTEEIARRRSPYRPQDVVLGRLHDLERQGLLERRATALAATDELLPLIEAIGEIRADAASATWQGHEADVDQASRTAHELGALVSDDHVVAAAHHGLPAPDDPYLRLHRRLVTLRYARQHDHVAAWLAEGLTASQIVVMTALWNGEDVAPGEAVAELAARGLASDDPPALTDAGQRMRSGIEDETNRRSQEIFTAFGGDETAEFLGVLRRLPG